MKNKNGFTIVELLVSLSITIVVIIVLFEIIILLKDLFQTTSLKTELLNKKSIIVDKVYTDVNDRLITRIEQCGDYCLEFIMNDASTKRLEINKDEKILKYDDYTIKLDETYSIGNIYFSNDVTTYISNENNNGILKIEIPIYSKLTGKENLGIDIVATYNTSNMAVGSLYLADEETNDCEDNGFCKDNTYAVGDKVKIGGYNWHIVKTDGATVTLLLDGNEIANRSHVAAGNTTYKWSNSYINKYLNDTFYKELIQNGVSELDVITNQVGICDDASNANGNTGALETESMTCNSSYVKSNVRLMTETEFNTIKNYLTTNSIDSSFLYSESIGKWALISAENGSNKIKQVNSSGTIESDTYTSLVNVRAVIVLAKN